MKIARKEAEGPPTLTSVTDQQFAEYCQSILGELRNIASMRRLDHLAQFLSVCLIEARRIEGKSAKTN